MLINNQILEKLNEAPNPKLKYWVHWGYFWFAKDWVENIALSDGIYQRGSSFQFYLIKSKTSSLTWVNKCKRVNGRLTQLYEVIQTDKSSGKPPPHSQSYWYHGASGKWPLLSSIRSIKICRTPFCEYAIQSVTHFILPRQSAKGVKGFHTAQYFTLQCLE